MHFQLPPFEHTKLVYVSRGKIRDVVIDIRKQSDTYGKCFSIELDDQKAYCLYIPAGFAHGFCRWRMIVLLTILKHLVTLKDMIVA